MSRQFVWTEESQLPATEKKIKKTFIQKKWSRSNVEQSPMSPSPAGIKENIEKFKKPSKERAWWSEMLHCYIPRERRSSSSKMLEIPCKIPRHSSRMWPKPSKMWGVCFKLNKQRESFKAPNGPKSMQNHQFWFQTVTKQINLTGDCSKMLHISSECAIQNGRFKRIQAPKRCKCDAKTVRSSLPQNQQPAMLWMLRLTTSQTRSHCERISLVDPQDSTGNVL